MDKSREPQSINIQESLSIGYIYLIVLGILSDTIYYNFIDINILEYSTILDVLITPISLLTRSWILPVLIILIFGYVYLFANYLGPKLNKKKMVEGVPFMTQTKQYVMAGGMIMVMFLGLGIGRGSAKQEKLVAGGFESDHQLVFMDSSILKVKVLGQNSLYVFYVAENQKEVSISPIAGNIQRIKILPPAE